MITTDFMGSYDDTFNSVIFDTNDKQYGVATALLILAVILIPGMLLSKPIIEGYLKKHDDEDHREIEFTNINRADNGLSDPMMGNNYQALNANEEDSSKKLTAEMINLRQNQMKDLDK